MEVLIGEFKGLLSLRPMCTGSQDTCHCQEGAGALGARAGSQDLALQAPTPAFLTFNGDLIGYFWVSLLPAGRC